jgi:hypothetical protein
MIEKSRIKGTLPAFAPVPRHYNRHDGWTPERQTGFIEALADTGSVKAAAHAVNMTPEGAYLLRRHPQAGEFRKAWEAALRLGVQRLEDVAMERALNGTEVPVYSYGKLIGARTVYNDRLLMFLLRNRAGKRFTADGRHDAPTRQELTKLKAQWIEEWKEENGHNRSPADVRAAIDRKVAEVRARMEARMSPETRRLRELYEASLAADREAPALPAPQAPGPGDKD